MADEQEPTQEQIELRAVYRDRWIAIGLNTEPAKRPEAEAAINAAYTKNKLAAPQIIVWCGSPLSQALTWGAFSKLASAATAQVISDKVTAACDASTKAFKKWLKTAAADAVYTIPMPDTRIDTEHTPHNPEMEMAIHDCLRDTLTKCMEESVDEAITSAKITTTPENMAAWRSILRYQIWSTVWTYTKDEIIYSKDSKVQDELQASVRDAIANACYGQHDASWLSVYAYYREVLGKVEDTESVVPLLELAQCAGWWLPRTDICFVCERPSDIQLDEAQRLHNKKGAAMTFRDGWKIYAVEGILVPDWIITNPEKINPETITAEQNVEIRRIMIEQIGWAEYIRQAELEPIDHRDNDVDHTKEALYRGPIDGLTIMVVTCPTGRVFGLPVGDVTTCAAAQVWLHGRNPKEKLNLLAST